MFSYRTPKLKKKVIGEYKLWVEKTLQVPVQLIIISGGYAYLMIYSLNSLDIKDIKNYEKLKFSIDRL